MIKKRSVLSVVLFLLFVAMTYAQSITLLMPNKGGDYAKGATTALTWKYSGISDKATVRVILFQNGTKIGVIAPSEPINQPPASLGYGGLVNKWKVGEYMGGSANTGCGYKIRVVVNGSEEDDYNDLPFCITEPGQNTFTLDSPKGGESWELDSTQKIAWTCKGYGGLLLIKLYKGGADWGAIKAGVAANAGSFDWKVGGNPKYHEYVPAKDYTISIEPVTKTVDSPTKRVSKPFSIVSGGLIISPGNILSNPNLSRHMAGVLADKWIKVISPSANEDVLRMDQHVFKWQCSDYMKKEWARLKLLRNGQPYRDLLAKFYLFHGNDYYQIDTDVPTGDYQLRIEPLDWPSEKADSGVFHVVAKISEATFFFDAETNNMHRWVLHKYKGITDVIGGAAFIAGQSVWPDPGPGKIRVGFKNDCEDGNGYCYAYRSWIHFDLQGREDVEVLSAQFNYKEDPGVPAPVHLYRLTQPWNGHYETLFSNAGLVDVNPNDLRSVVQEWMKNPAENYGLVMMGNNENYTCNKNGAIHILYDVKLQVQEKHVQ